MRLLHDLSIIIQRSHSTQDILEKTVDLIVEELGTDVCSIYLLDSVSKKLVLTASHGLDKAAVGKVELDPGQGLTGKVFKEIRPLAVDDASSHPGYLYFPETREERFKSFLGVPMAIRNRPIGAIVVQTHETRHHSQEDIQTLSTISAQLVGVVETARLIEALDRGDEGLQYLRELRSWHASDSKPAADRRNIHLSGSAASPGIAIGEAVVRGSYEMSGDDLQRTYLGADMEKNRVRAALEKTRNDLLKIQKDTEKHADEEHALIFSSHLLLLNDPVLMKQVDADIEKGNNGAAAVHRALSSFAERLQGVDDPYLRERVEDIHDLRGRITSYLLFGGSSSPSVSDKIVIAQNIPPSLVVELKAKGARALITDFGGATSHGALLARSMGVPAVTGIGNISNLVRTGDQVIVDGSTGVVWINPSQETTEKYERERRAIAKQRSDSLQYCHMEARTADGVRVQILANIGVSADLTIAKESGAEGIGLYRTEFPFIIREHFPTREEQINIYREAYVAFPNAPIHFRLLDLGGDKFLAGGLMTSDRNPFHGYRSIRVLLDYPDVLRNQVQAFALAAGQRSLSIMIPMVSTIDEVRKTRELVDEALRQLPGRAERPDAQLGVMIELPAAVEIARNLAQVVDFFSIGTNDLIQYTLAVDRENSRVSSTHDSYHPAILRMIYRTIKAGHSENIPVSVCGEIAADRKLSLLLVAMGVDSLSITPSGILNIKQILAKNKIRTLQNRVEEILSLADALAIEQELEALYPQE